MNRVWKKISLVWSYLKGAYWFIPGLMTVCAVLMAFYCIELDKDLEEGVFPVAGWLLSGGVEGAREVLSSIAGSVITVAGVVFSVTIVTLSLAAQQYGPRLLRNFIRDRPSQFVFGTFASTFAFCIIVLRSVRGENDFVESSFVPHIGVAVSLGLAVTSVFVLIFFIHHTAQSIQASHIAKRTADELRATICTLYPESPAYAAEASPEEAFQLPPIDQAREIGTSFSGYLETINAQDILTLACRHDVLIEMIAQPGDFLSQGDCVARVWGAGEDFEEWRGKLKRALVFGKQRTMENDVEFGFAMLLEMAVRALSPSLNDPFTAVLCIHHLKDCFLLLASRDVPSALRLDDNKQPRVIARPKTLGSILTLVTRQLHHYGKDAPLVMEALASLVEAVLERVKAPKDQAAAKRCATLVA